jgi:hypothetical protein
MTLLDQIGYRESVPENVGFPWCLWRGEVIFRGFEA